MHNNYYFLRQITRSLESRLTDAVISECFSQTKDELIVRFEIGAQSFYIRANLSPELSCLSFSESFKRARKNSVDLFPGLIGTRVRQVRQFLNERSFVIKLTEGRDMLFKMHANRSNIAVFEFERVTELFRNNIIADRNLELSGLDREIDWGKETFLHHVADLRSLYFTFGKVVWQYLDVHGFSSLNAEQKWERIRHVLLMLESPSFYITMLNGRPTLSLLQIGDIEKVVTDPVEAANEFFYIFTQRYAFSKEKSRLVNFLHAKLVAGENYCRKNSLKLDEVLADDHYRLWADLLMANLHAIKPGSEVVVLPNFYDEQRQEEIQLKRDLTPQKNAELLYRKAKNQHIEIERLKNSIKQKQLEMQQIRTKIEDVESMRDLKSLRALETLIGPATDVNEKLTLPYHEFHVSGFRILVGKNAAANDELTLKYSHKDDLWLHAKDVSGSHVLIKHQSGKNFPKDVIEYAASLAAFNSKRRNESLCPVIATPKKYVRKRKGDPPGAVVVEREEVIMIEPLRSIGH